jgi:hypothetical protein
LLVFWQLDSKQKILIDEVMTGYDKLFLVKKNHIWRGGRRVTEGML